MSQSDSNPYAIDDAAVDLLFREARTANTFTDEPVSDEQLEALYEIVKFGPTAMNLQSLRIVAVRTAEAKERLLGHMSKGNKAKTESAPLVLILAADVDFHEQFHITFPHSPTAKDSFPDPARREVMARQQAWLQAGYLILGVRALGLAAGPMAGFNAASLDEDFFAGTSWRSFCVVNVGKPGPDAWRERLPRLAFEDAVRTL